MALERFAGKVALITGGGTGIGAASAKRIAAEGGKVVVMGRREAPLLAIAKACDGHAVIGDTASLDDLTRAVAEAEDRFGGLDVLVANAGIEQFGSVETIALADWRRVFEVNLEGAMLAARASIPAMRKRWRCDPAGCIGRGACGRTVVRFVSDDQGWHAGSEPVNCL